MVYTFTDFRASELAQKPHFAVLGHPISHSLSPLMHQTALDKYGIDARYVAIDLAADKLPEFISWCNNDKFLGCNITIPYKETFMSVVDEIDSFAKDVGVINTIVKNEYKLVGYNTDVFGFLEPLQPFLSDMDIHRAVIFGTGGASKAVKTALESLYVDELIFVSRNPSGKSITSNTGSVRIVDYNQWQPLAEEAELLINTTPVGMYPKDNETFLREGESHILADKICYDLIYNPLQTKFLSLAEKQGAVTINGLDMLIHQGSKSFEFWTGHSFPFDDIKRVLIEHLENSE